MKTFVPKTHSTGPAFILFLIVFILTVWAVYLDNKIFTSVDRYVYDRFLFATPHKSLKKKITIIDIDETSLSAVGQWPWPRYMVADLVKKISDLSPASLTIDIIFPEPDTTSLSQIKKQFKRDFQIDLGFKNAPLQLNDNDFYLSFILNKYNVIGSRYFFFDNTNKKSDCNWNPINISGKLDKLQLHNANGILCNTFQLEKSFKYTGFNNSQNDSDGLMRRLPLLIKYNNKIFAHLALTTLMSVKKVKDIVVGQNFYGMFIKVGDITIPISKQGYTHLKFNGPSHEFKYVSAVDILNNKVLYDLIKDKIILIGSSAVGLFDMHQTMFDAHYPGVESNAVFLDCAMQKKLISIPGWSKHVIFVVSLTIGWLMVFMVIDSSPPSIFGIWFIVSGAIIIISSFTIFKTKYLFISPGRPLLLGFVEFSFISFTRFILAQKATLLWYQKLLESHQVTMDSLVNLVETRDPETAQHIKRTQHYAKAIATEMKKIDIFSKELTPEFLETLFLSVPLHDIGKVGVPDNILLKPGKLTDDEFKLMKLHASYGKYAIEKSTNKLGKNNFLQMAAHIAGHHHERWDGNGYPEGLLETEIPLAARIMAICDVYDALISKRCYKEPFSHEKALSIIKEGRGSHFDPIITDCFININEEIRQIAMVFKDELDYGDADLKDLFIKKID